MIHLAQEDMKADLSVDASMAEWHLQRHGILNWNRGEIQHRKMFVFKRHNDEADWDTEAMQRGRPYP